MLFIVKVLCWHIWNWLWQGVASKCANCVLKTALQIINDNSGSRLMWFRLKKSKVVLKCFLGIVFGLYTASITSGIVEILCEEVTMSLIVMEQYNFSIHISVLPRFQTTSCLMSLLPVWSVSAVRAATLNRYPSKHHKDSLLFLFSRSLSVRFSDKHVQSCCNLTNNLWSIQTGSHYPVPKALLLISGLTSVESSLLHLLAHAGLLQ